MNETMNEKAISALIEIEKAKDLIKPFNDYGDATGFCDEYDQIANDTFAALGSLRARAYRLQMRVTRYQRDKNP